MPPKSTKKAALGNGLVKVKSSSASPFSTISRATQVVADVFNNSMLCDVIFSFITDKKQLRQLLVLSKPCFKSVVKALYSDVKISQIKRMMQTDCNFHRLTNYLHSVNTLDLGDISALEEVDIKKYGQQFPNLKALRCHQSHFATGAVWITHIDVLGNGDIHDVNMLGLRRKRDNDPEFTPPWLWEVLDRSLCFFGKDHKYRLKTLAECDPMSTISWYDTRDINRYDWTTTQPLLHQFGSSLTLSRKQSLQSVRALILLDQPNCWTDLVNAIRACPLLETLRVLVKLDHGTTTMSKAVFQQLNLAIGSCYRLHNLSFFMSEELAATMYQGFGLHHLCNWNMPGLETLECSLPFIAKISFGSSIQSKWEPNSSLSTLRTATFFMPDCIEEIDPCTFARDLVESFPPACQIQIRFELGCDNHEDLDCDEDLDRCAIANQRQRDCDLALRIRTEFVESQKPAAKPGFSHIQEID